jgi:hypothetical protein
MTYRTLTAAAQNVGAEEQTMLEFQRAGWIRVVVKDGRSFVAAPDEYRCRFILHLRRKLKLSDKEIEIVLANERSPYSLDQVPTILARYAADE